MAVHWKIIIYVLSHNHMCPSTSVPLPPPTKQIRSPPITSIATSRRQTRSHPHLNRRQPRASSLPPNPWYVDLNPPTPKSPIRSSAFLVPSSWHLLGDLTNVVFCSCSSQPLRLEINVCLLDLTGSQSPCRPSTSRVTLILLSSLILFPLWWLVEIFSMVREGQVGGLAPHGGMVSSHSVFGSIHWISSHFVCVCSALTALACLLLLLIICRSHHVGCWACTRGVPASGIITHR